MAGVGFQTCSLLETLSRTMTATEWDIWSSSVGLLKPPSLLRPSECSCHMFVRLKVCTQGPGLNPGCEHEKSKACRLRQMPVSCHTLIVQVIGLACQCPAALSQRCSETSLRSMVPELRAALIQARVQPCHGLLSLELTCRPDCC